MTVEKDNKEIVICNNCALDYLIRLNEADPKQTFNDVETFVSLYK